MIKTYEVIGPYITLIGAITLVIIIAAISAPENWMAWTILGEGIVMLLLVTAAMAIKIVEYTKKPNPQVHQLGYDYNAEYLRLRDLLDINTPGFKIRTDKKAWSINERTIVYRLYMDDTAAPSTMLKALPAIKTQLYTWRKEHGAKVDRGFNIVFDDMPPCLIVPRVNPTPMLYQKRNMKLEPFHMVVGKDYSGETPEFVTVDIRSPDGFTTLMLGSSGSGKSTLLNTMLLSLLESTSPSELCIHIIDLGEKNLSHFDNIQHTVSYITTLDDCRFFLNYVESQLNGPQNSFDINNIIICDEFLSLTMHKDIADKLITIFSKMRGYGWSALCLTQTANNVIPTNIRDNMMTRICLKCQREAQSESILGKGNTQGTQLVRGSCIVQYDDYDGLVNTYYIKLQNVKKRLNQLRRFLGNSFNNRLVFHTQPIKSDNIEIIPPKIRQIINQEYDTNSGKLKRGSKAKIIRYILNLGPQEKIPTGTTYNRMSNQVDEYINTYKGTL